MNDSLLHDRSRGVDLLRLICCFFIVNSHMLLDFFPRPELNEAMGWILFIVPIATLVGVEVQGFMCISGYYGVKRDFHKLFTYACMIWCYSLCQLVISLWVGQRPNLESLVHLVAPISTGNYWYATAYFVLVLLSPYLNRVIMQKSDKEDRQIVFTMGILFLGIPTVLYWGPNGSYSSDWIIMIVYYCIIGIIRRQGLFVEWSASRIFVCTVTCYLLMVILNFAATVAVGARMPFGYFMPFSRGCTLTMFFFSLGVFELFRRLPLRGRVIPALGRFAFPVYILEKSIKMMVERYVNPAQIGLHYGYGVRLLIMTGYALIIMGIAVLIECMRRLVFLRFEERVYGVLSNKVLIARKE